MKDQKMIMLTLVYTPAEPGVNATLILVSAGNLDSLPVHAQGELN
jgi:hypothetical protein